ncbi:MAG TPA: hypothetical protein VNL77_24730 [Roseiflexaceae bacterium]|nr:hypothetical protein [Roseiflexaceae bacterium]
MGRFFLGFVVGALIGALLVLLTMQRDEAAEGVGLRAGEPAGLGALLAGALRAGREAASARERELMAEYRSRLKAKR